MWALVRADFSYTRVGLVIMGLAVAFFFFQDATQNHWRFYQFVNNSAVVALMGVGIIAAKGDKERRDRGAMRLPVAIASVGAARAIYVLIVLSVLTVVWSSYLLFRPGGGSVSDLCVMFNAAAVTFILFLAFVINHDLGYYDTRRHRYQLCAVLVVLVAAFAVLGFTHVLDTWGPAYGAFLMTLPGVLAHGAIAAALYALSMRVFMGRRSYLS